MGDDTDNLVLAARRVKEEAVREERKRLLVIVLIALALVLAGRMGGLDAIAKILVALL